MTSKSVEFKPQLLLAAAAAAAAKAASIVHIHLVSVSCCSKRSPTTFLRHFGVLPLHFTKTARLQQPARISDGPQHSNQVARLLHRHTGQAAASACLAGNAHTLTHTHARAHTHTHTHTHSHTHTPHLSQALADLHFVANTWWKSSVLPEIAASTRSVWGMLDVRVQMPVNCCFCILRAGINHQCVACDMCRV